jgi:Protocatechuate 3,4-dioxygenase beta subunit
METQVTRRTALSLITGGLWALATGLTFEEALAASSAKRSLKPKRSFRILTPEQTEGPFYVAKHLVRRDIREDRQGVPLILNIILRDSSTGEVLPNAAVDIWHCDAEGNYSGYAALAEGHPLAPPGFDPQLDSKHQGPPPSVMPSDDRTFLRGTQISDIDGIVRFTTIYPGWYQGRALHIHLKVHTGKGVERWDFTDSHVCHTGQLFFPEQISNKVAAVTPYKEHELERLRQEDDFVFQTQQGKKCLVSVESAIVGDKKGYSAAVVLGINPNATPKKV